MMNKIQHFPSRLWRLLALALPLAACTSEVTDEALPGSASPITFRTAEVTKAVVTGFNDGDAFSVWGGYDNDATNVFDDVPVTYNGSAWTYSPSRYWVADKEYRFYAVYPTGFGSCDALGTITVSNFDSSKGNDLMTAQSNVMNGSNPQQVAFTFNHLLSRIRCTVKAEQGVTGCSVQALGLYGIYTAGNYDSSSISPWTVSGSALTADAALAFITESSDVTPGMPLEGTDMLLIPQALTDTRLHFVYTLNGQQEETTVNLAESGAVLWEAGVGYNYVLTIESGAINFTLQVEPWTSASTGGSIIIH